MQMPIDYLEKLRLKYQIGHVCILLAVYIIIADTTSLRLRLFCSYIPSLPTIVSPGDLALG
jgi:hypothetical protein